MTRAQRVPAGYTVARIPDRVNVDYVPMTLTRALRIADRTRRTLVACGRQAGEDAIALAVLARAVRRAYRLARMLRRD